jgi:hypothetical protein
VVGDRKEGRGKSQLRIDATEELARKENNDCKKGDVGARSNIAFEDNILRGLLVSASSKRGLRCRFIGGWGG